MVCCIVWRCCFTAELDDPTLVQHAAHNSCPPCACRNWDLVAWGWDEPDWHHTRAWENWGCPAWFLGPELHQPRFGPFPLQTGTWRCRGPTLSSSPLAAHVTVNKRPLQNCWAAAQNRHTPADPAHQLTTAAAKAAVCAYAGCCHRPCDSEPKSESSSDSGAGAGTAAGLTLGLPFS